MFQCCARQGNVGVAKDCTEKAALNSLLCYISPSEVLIMHISAQLAASVFMRG